MRKESSPSGGCGSCASHCPTGAVSYAYPERGDLVRRLQHAEHPASSQASVAVWNLITRNTQAVKTGIYIYTIESRFGTDIGKLVIIK